MTLRTSQYHVEGGSRLQVSHNSRTDCTLAGFFTHCLLALWRDHCGGCAGEGADEHPHHSLSFPLISTVDDALVAITVGGGDRFASVVEVLRQEEVGREVLVLLAREVRLHHQMLGEAERLQLWVGGNICFPCNIQ